MAKGLSPELAAKYPYLEIDFHDIVADTRCELKTLLGDPKTRCRSVKLFTLASFLFEEEIHRFFPRNPKPECADCSVTDFVDVLTQPHV